MESLKIEKLGPLGSVDVSFGDLTIIVGPQASGKSVFLETLKLVDDREFIVSTLERYGYIFGRRPKKILDAYFGQGMSAMWTNQTRIESDGRTFIRVACADGWITLGELQIAGKKRLPVRELLLGLREIGQYRFQK